MEPTIGHNAPPPEIKTGEALRDDLQSEHHSLLDRRDELLAMADRFDHDYAAVEDDEASGLLAGIITQINGASKVADKVREGVKAPYIEGGRIVDGFFNGNISSLLDKRAAALNAKQTAYQRARADRIRREAEEKARKAREEEEAQRKEAERAERERKAAEREAKKATDDEEQAKADALARDAADRVVAARQAQHTARLLKEQSTDVATSNAADRSRVRGDYAMASLRTTWKFRVVDIRQVPAEYVAVNESVINALIRGKNGKREIPGLEIYSVEEAVNR